MSDIALSGKDLDLTGHRLSLVTDEAAIAQQVYIRCRFFLGEWFLDTRLGIPYFRDIFIKAPNLLLIQSIFRTALLDTPGISSVTSVETSLNKQERTLTLSFSAVMDTGAAIVFEPFIIEL